MTDKDAVDRADPLGSCHDGSMGLSKAVRMATMFPMDPRLAQNLNLAMDRAATLSADLEQANARDQGSRMALAEAIRQRDEAQSRIKEQETALRCHMQVLAETQAERDEANARVAAAYGHAADQWLNHTCDDGRIVTSLMAMSDTIRALATDAEYDALASLIARAEQKAAEEMRERCAAVAATYPDQGDWDAGTHQAGGMILDGQRSAARYIADEIRQMEV